MYYCKGSGATPNPGCMCVCVCVCSQSLTVCWSRRSSHPTTGGARVHSQAETRCPTRRNSAAVRPDTSPHRLAVLLHTDGGAAVLSPTESSAKAASEGIEAAVAAAAAASATALWRSLSYCSPEFSCGSCRCLSRTFPFDANAEPPEESSNSTDPDRDSADLDGDNSPVESANSPDTLDCRPVWTTNE